MTSHTVHWSNSNVHTLKKMNLGKKHCFVHLNIFLLAYKCTVFPFRLWKCIHELCTFLRILLPHDNSGCMDVFCFCALLLCIATLLMIQCVLHVNKQAFWHDRAPSNFRIFHHSWGFYWAYHYLEICCPLKEHPLLKVSVLNILIMFNLL